jgi:hypothetical protein
MMRVIICEIVLLDFVRRLNYKIIKLNVSEAGFCFRLQVKRGGGGTGGLSAGPHG